MARTTTIKPEMAEAKSLGLLNIGEAANASGVSAKSIRHYEDSGLIPKAQRTFANYRLYTQSDVHMLRFIKSARSLGFSIADIGKLLQLWKNQKRSSGDVKKLALQHVAEMDAKIRAMQDMSDTLKHLANSCHGDARPECPILQDLANHSH